MKVQCCECLWKGDEEDLVPCHIGCKENDREWVMGCPNCRTDVFLLNLEEDEFTATRDPSFEDLYGAHGEYEDDYKVQMKNKNQEDK